ncbi:MAG: hypothetical protein KDD73_00850 [Anaerolineales bacterium]|nr:hypothetical protein [Anaerolineales bacterium]MCB9129099.1 hypothetical protein [Ardenticatenales bacterium]
MNQTNRTLTFRQGANVLGALSLAIGLLFLLGEMLNLRLSADFWPLFIVVPALALFGVTLFLDEAIGTALAIVSAITTVAGLILWVQALSGYGSTWPYTWTLLFPTAIGVGLLAYGIGKKRAELRYAGWGLVKFGLALFLLFAVFFEFILGLGGFNLKFGWPLLLLSLGLLFFTLRSVDFQRYESLFAKDTTVHPK